MNKNKRIGFLIQPMRFFIMTMFEIVKTIQNIISLAYMNQLTENKLAILMNNMTINKISKEVTGSTVEEVCRLVHSWWNKECQYIELNLTGYEFIKLRLYRNHFELKNNELKFQSYKAMAVFAVYRLATRKHAISKKICKFTPKMEQLVNEKISEIKQQQILHNNKSLPTGIMPTLLDIAKSYELAQRSDGVPRPKAKTNLVLDHFSELLHYPVNSITKKELFSWLMELTTKLSANELANNVSPFERKVFDENLQKKVTNKVEPQTIYGAICTLRGMLTWASKHPEHPFDLDLSLYDDDFKIHISNYQTIYLTEEEIKSLYIQLKERDDREKTTGCVFTDYLSPLIMLCLSMGLRPDYALRIKLTDLEYSSNLILIRGNNGKIKKGEISLLTDDMIKVIKEWLTHPIHKKNTGGWLFPSFSTNAKYNDSRLVDYSKQLNKLKFDYDLPSLNFILIRHTFGTQITKFGKDIFLTQRLMHHKKVTTTKDRYAHHIEENTSITGLAAMNCLPSVLDAYGAAL
jgi:integrase